MVDNEQMILDALENLHPDSLDYQEWCNVGMALKHEGIDFSIWDSWSSRGSKYNAREMQSKWDSFQENSLSVVSGGTIIHLAQAKGTYIKKEKKTKGKSLDWTFEIDLDYTPITSPKTVAEKGIEVPKEVSFKGEFRRYIDLLFDDEDYIGYVVQSLKTEKGKWVPANKGVYSKKKKEFLFDLEKYKDKDISYILGDYNEEAGAWIRFNPLDGEGCSDKNVTEYRYALVECDNISIEKQYALIKELQLPVKVLVSSGGKSLHAIVKVDAYDHIDYARKVKFLYQICESNGLSVDTANKNPSRLSRMPGAKRGDKYQFIVAENIGLSSFEEWESYIKDATSKIPQIESLSDVWNNMPPLKPEIISGILRKGHKMMISSSSKAGKTWAMIELCIAIATGTKWLGKYDCQEGKVLYMNLEVDNASCFDRFKKVYIALGLTGVPKNIDIWNLRGYVSTLEKLTPTLIKRCENNNYSMIVIDPIYKVQDGDENSAGDISRFCNNIDKIATELEASVVYVHHHSKGGQGGKNAQDRASGSGVFARDPDALLDFIQIDPEDMELGENETVWRIESVLREFAPIDRAEFVFSYPIHKPIEGLENAKVLEPGQKEFKERTDANRIKHNQMCLEKFKYLDKGNGVLRKDLCDLLASDEGVTTKSAGNWIDTWLEENKGRIEQKQDEKNKKYKVINYVI